MIRIPILSEFKDAGFKDAQKATESFEKQLKGLAKTAGIAFGAAAVIDFGKKAVSAAVDLGESVNAVNVVFGESSEAVLKLGEDAARSVGLSTAAFNSLSVELAGFAGQLTTNGQDISEVIDTMTTRAADFASVMNISVDEAVGVFQSTLAGSSEVIRKYGVDVSAAAVEQYLLNNGIAASKGDITEAMKVQGRYALIMEGTAATAGDFTNTSDSLANQQKILKAELENVSAELGEALIPLLSSAAQAALELTEFLDDIKVPEALDWLANAKSNLHDFGVWLRTGGKMFGYQDVKMLDASVEKFGELDWTLLETARSYDQVREALLKQYDASWNTLDFQHLVNLTFIERKKRIKEASDENQRALQADLAAAVERGFAIAEATKAQEAYMKSIKHTRDEAGALRRELSKRSDIISLGETFMEVNEQLQDGALAAYEQEQAMIDLKLEVLDYAEQINLPDRVVTQLIADLDEGALDEVWWFLARMADGVTLPIKPLVIANETTGTNIRVDEFGNVRSLGAGTSTSNNNITVNMAPGANGDDVVDALQRWVRDNGSLPVYTSQAVGP